MADEEKTTIAINKSTKEKLDHLGDKGDTYDEIINRLIGNKGQKQQKPTAKPSEREGKI